MAEIASFVVVDAGVGGAAKAAETVVATSPNMSEAFAQYLPIKEDTEEQEELWVKRVIGVPFGSHYSRNFSTHGNLLSEADLLH